MAGFWKGQGLPEYAMIIALIAIAVITAVTLIGPSVGGVFSQIGNSIPVTGH